MLLERGAAAITMEGLAVQAGVSKALPYIHFDNAEAVLIGCTNARSPGLERG